MKTGQVTTRDTAQKGVRIEIIPRHTRFTEGHAMYFDQEAKQWRDVDTTMARLYFADGRVVLYDDQTLAFFVWLNLPKGVRVAFRGRNDTTPVYPWNIVDAP